MITYTPTSLTFWPQGTGVSIGADIDFDRIHERALDDTGAVTRDLGPFDRAGRVRAKADLGRREGDQGAK